MGGAGGIGGAGGMGGAGGSGPVAIKEWDVKEAQTTGQPPVYVLGVDWLSITCPTNLRTSQNSPSSLVTGYGPDAARPRAVGKGPGLSVENRRTNRIHNSDTWGGTGMPAAEGWTKSTMSPSAAEGPAQGSSATQFDSAGTQQSNYVSGLPSGYASAWLKGSDLAVIDGNLVVHTDANGNWDAADYVAVSSNGWQRYEISDAAGYFRLETRGDNKDPEPAPIASPTTITAYGAQHEPGADYPSSYIPTQSDERTREPDKLYVHAPGLVAPGGFFHLKLTFAPNYAHGENGASEHDLFWSDNDNRVFLRFSDNKIVLRIDGQNIESLPITWQREQAITVEAVHSLTERRLIVSGATPSNFSDAPLPLKPVSLLAPFYILGNNDGAQECADLRYIGFFPPN
ncbi:phage head spike fiber domain-containing protein [Polyangium aurulentum]|uniref:phage head spike fiber domain-containing protein n=1 Tax=Polyangium aurulentum TaxID=2567896 RepID=UPI00198104B1|nr:hypothetical protein [Polyangium aurulentum]UQA64071.1 hypothetical protein E8A73_018820 [Polyangium aurulentum]